jgi:Tol biopolymer transport system component
MFTPKESFSRNCVGFIIGFVILQLACSKKSPTRPDLSEDRGIALTEKDEQVSIDKVVWSADGQEIFYVSSQSGGGSSRVRAVKVTDKSKRIIGGGNNAFWLHGLSPDGKYLYYAAAPSNDNPGLFRVPTNGQNAELLIGDLAVIGSEPACALSTDNRSIAYTSLRGEVDSLFIFDTANRSKRFYAVGLPVTFSPDGKQLLFYKTFWYDSLYTVSLDNGSIQLISRDPTAAAYKLWMIRWDSQGIRILLSGAGTFIRNITTGATTTVFSGNPSGGFVGWSADGNKFAYWSTRDILGPANAFYQEYSINLIDLNSNQPIRVAYGNNATGRSGGLGAMAFSPGSKRIAFVFDEIYLKDI